MHQWLWGNHTTFPSIISLQSSLIVEMRILVDWSCEILLPEVF